MHRSCLIALVGLCSATTNATELQRFRYDPEQPLITLPVTFRDQECAFVLDTGATISGFDKSLRPMLDGPVAVTEMGTASRPMTVELFAPPRARIGWLPFTVYGPVSCFDFTVDRDIAPPIFGVIGMDFLSQFILAIDPDAAEVRFWAADTEPSPDWGVPLQLTFGESRIPQVRAWVNGQGPLLFGIDLGGVGTAQVCREDLANQLPDDWQYSCSAWVHDAAGASYTVMARSKEFSLGQSDFHHENLVVTLGNGNRLGLNYLTRYQMVFDFARRRLYLTPSERYSEFDRDDLAGVTLDRNQEGEAQVSDVEDGSEGFVAGIRQHDRLLRMDDDDISKRPLWRATT